MNGKLVSTKLLALVHRQQLRVAEDQRLRGLKERNRLTQSVYFKAFNSIMFLLSNSGKLLWCSGQRLHHQSKQPQFHTRRCQTFSAPKTPGTTGFLQFTFTLKACIPHISNDLVSSALCFGFKWCQYNCELSCYSLMRSRVGCISLYKHALNVFLLNAQINPWHAFYAKSGKNKELPIKMLQFVNQTPFTFNDWYLLH